MAAVENGLNYLNKRKFVVIFEESKTASVFGGNNSYCAQFGRNTISTMFALQETLEDAKQTYQWMKSMKNDLDFPKYENDTADAESKRFGLADFSKIPEWNSFYPEIEKSCGSACCTCCVSL